MAILLGGSQAADPDIVSAITSHDCKTDALHADRYGTGSHADCRPGSAASISRGRATDVTKDNGPNAVADEELAYFSVAHGIFRPKEKSSQCDGERLVRAREAMILTMQVFNSPSPFFKAEKSAVLANIAKACLLHEYHAQQFLPVTDAKAGRVFPGT